MSTSTVLSHVATLLMAAAGLSALELVQLPDPSGPVVARLPWVAAAAPAQQLTTLWEHQGATIGCTLGAAQSPAGIELAVMVRDPSQDNAYSGKQLWRGDCVYVIFDGRGDGGSEPPGVDDGTVIMGLGSVGAECQVSRHGRSERTGSHPELLRGLERDEAAACTRYRLLLPWDLLGSAPGLSARIGLSLIVAHKDEQKQDTLWGSAKALNVVDLDPPVEPGAAASTGPALVLEPSVIPVAACVTAPAILEVGLGDARQELPVAPGAWRRMRVRMLPEALALGGGTVQLRLLQAGKTVWEQQQHYRSLGMLEQEVADRVALLRRNREPATAALVGWYLDSLDACLAQARNQRPFMGDAPAWPAQYGQVLELLLAKLPSDRVDLALHSRRGTPLVGAFVSRADDTLQFYSLQLPFAFDPAQTYPISIYLHGYGSPYAMNGLALAYDNRHQDTLFREVDIDPAQVPPLHRGFVLAPWARGNGFYAGTAGQDVLQSLWEVERRFHVDPDRRYLSGFSMGCHGAARLASYRPDLWAGVNLASGFGYWSDANRPTLLANLAQLPVAIWCGEQDDRMLPGAKALAEKLAQVGCRVSTRIVPRLPHTYPYDEYNRMVGELSQFRRESSPSSFSFRTDCEGGPGRNGIDMHAELANDGSTAGFTCSITGATVTIASDGCDGLRIDCVRLGLAGQPELVVIWNGKESYRGKPGVIFLPKKFELWDSAGFELR